MIAPQSDTGQITCVEGDTFCVSGTSGQIRRGGEQGLFSEDARYVDLLLLRLDGMEPQPLRGQRLGANSARFTAYWRASDDMEPDPHLLVNRWRRVEDSLWEQVELTNFGTDTVSVAVEFEVGTDFVSVFDVKHGRHGSLAKGRVDDGMLRLEDPELGLSTLLRTTPSADKIVDASGLLCWDVTLPPRATWTVTLEVGTGDGTTVRWPEQPGARGSGRVTSSAGAPWYPPIIRCSDTRFPALISQSVADLANLLLEDPAAPEDRFLAAGSPWFLTLFGRDSLWSAFMTLPLGTEVAHETLRVLARRQGTDVDRETEEAPGKILHEIRRGRLVGRADLPPVYYGSVDATLLFVMLLHEAWCWGLPDDAVEALLPAAEAALGWLRHYADPDGDGFVEYVQHGRRGLANQGWKDSSDGVQFADGRLAEPPVALCEVQGYAHDAMVRGAALFDRFGRPGAGALRGAARTLRARFREAFWVEHLDGAYPAVALDGVKQRVDSVASNMGHLLTTGLLEPPEMDLVARRLGSPELTSGWGLRTLSTASPRFNPLSYHGGSVWPHDTAIAVHNLAAHGYADEANPLLRGLVAAAPFFNNRLPELFGGEERAAGTAPLPYPAACRPQAWAAGAALLLLRAVLGLHPHVPDKRLELRPLWPAPYRRVDVRDLPVAGGRLSMTVLRDEGVYLLHSPEGLDVDVVGAPRIDGPPPGEPPPAVEL